MNGCNSQTIAPPDFIKNDKNLLQNYLMLDLDFKYYAEKLLYVCQCKEREPVESVTAKSWYKGFISRGYTRRMFDTACEWVIEKETNGKRLDFAYFLNPDAKIRSEVGRELNRILLEAKNYIKNPKRITTEIDYNTKLAILYQVINQEAYVARLDRQKALDEFKGQLEKKQKERFRNHRMVLKNGSTQLKQKVYRYLVNRNLLEEETDKDKVRHLQENIYLLAEKIPFSFTEGKE